jgi:hypothetical protein
MKNVVFWDVTPCGSCNDGRFGGTYSLHHQGAAVGHENILKSNVLYISLFRL